MIGERITCTSKGERKIDTRSGRPHERILALVDDGDAAVGGGDHAVRRDRRDALGIAEEAERGQRGGGEGQGQPAPAPQGEQGGHGPGHQHERPALAGDGNACHVGLSYIRGGLIQDIMARSRLPDLFDLMVGVAPPHGQESRPVGLVLQHPLPGELARLDLAEDLLHLGLGLLAHHARPARVVAVLRGVGDGVAHVGEPALVEEVDDQLHLVHALEVRDLGLIAGLHQGLEGGLDEVRDASAQGGLLAEEIGLRLFLERGLDDAGPRAAHALAVGQGQVARLARDVLVDGHQGRHPRALGEEIAHDVAGGLGGDHAARPRRGAGPPG